MGRDRVELGALFALVLTFACGQPERADEPSRNDKSSNSHSADDADEEADDEDQAAEEEKSDEADEEKEEPKEVEPAPEPPKPKDAGVAPVVDPPAPPPTRGLGDAGAEAPPAAASNSGFNAGSGELQPDGQTVIYRIPEGTGKKDWNPKAKPIRVKPGMVLRFIDTDSTAKGDGHWLHTFGQPCPHSQRAIGMGYDCKIRADAPAGIVPSTLEHSPSNFGGRVYIEVDREGAPPASSSSTRAR